jgi:hypothetical protein
MEMMMEMKAERDGDVAVEMVWLEASMERLAAAAEMLEKAIERLDEQQKAAAVNAEAGVERIVATVGSPREAELERRLAAVETELAGLRTEAVVSATSSLQMAVRRFRWPWRPCWPSRVCRWTRRSRPRWIRRWRALAWSSGLR